jgi:lipopolysaccharide transport system permease protein
MVHLVDAYRAILLHGTAPNWDSLLVLSGLAAGILYVSLWLFKRVSYRFVEEL